jgi:hypothetical protein
MLLLFFSMTLLAVQPTWDKLPKTSTADFEGIQKHGVTAVRMNRNRFDHVSGPL